MKKVLLYFIAVLFLAGCGREVEPVAVEEQPLPFAFDDGLQAIDSVLQHNADSALTMLLSFRANSVIATEAQRSGEISSTFNDNYLSLLISEALYKTYNQQYYRAQLQSAMHYFDSIAAYYPANDNLTMLSARSHYMNGVGFYENDSLVEACTEYLHTMEIMENHFNEDEMTGYKAKFMGLTYTRLGEMFYYNYIAQASIEAYKKALYYYNKVADYSLANTYRHIGGSYFLNNNNDSALLYYRKAIDASIQQDKLFEYTAALSESALIYYESGYQDSAFNMIRKAMALSNNEDQRLANCFTLGLLFYNEHEYDSAIFYLKQSILRDEYHTCTASQEKLIDCYHALGDTINERYYKLKHNESLKRFVEVSPHKVELLTLYEEYKQNQAQKQHKIMTDKMENKLLIISSVILFSVVFVVLFSIYKHRKNNRIISVLKNKIKANTFEEEPICVKILDMVKTGRFKAQMDFVLYSEFALGIEQLKSLRDAVDEHFDYFTKHVRERYPDLTNDDISYCCLYLLGLKDADVSALMQRSYRAVCDRNKKIRTVFGTEDSINTFLRDMAQNMLS